MFLLGHLAQHFMALMLFLFLALCSHLLRRHRGVEGQREHRGGVSGSPQQFCSQEEKGGEAVTGGEKSVSNIGKQSGPGRSHWEFGRTSCVLTYVERQVGTRSSCMPQCRVREGCKKRNGCRMFTVFKQTTVVVETRMDWRGGKAGLEAVKPVVRLQMISALASNPSVSVQQLYGLVKF